MSDNEIMEKKQYCYWLTYEHPGCPDLIHSGNLALHHL